MTLYPGRHYGNMQVHTCSAHASCIIMPTSLLSNIQDMFEALCKCTLKTPSHKIHRFLYAPSHLRWLSHAWPQVRLIKHALHSSLAAQTATAKFMFLPNWKGMSTNAYMKVVNNHPKSCTILGHIPQTSLTYGQPQGWEGAPNVLPPPRWDMDIIVIWNGEARKQLSETNLGWYTGLRQNISEAKWNLNPCPPTTASANIPTITRAL